ncbi:MAG: Arc-like DNA-binding protein [Inoviridae sp.]|nr:MAG: Arc-like DNA-binding protein [Inoviridae sp.]
MYTMYIVTMYKVRKGETNTMYNKKHYDRQYVKENYYMLHVNLYKSYKPIIDQKAKKHGSITKYIKFLIDEDLQKDNNLLIAEENQPKHDENHQA